MFRSPRALLPRLVLVAVIGTAVACSSSTSTSSGTTTTTGRSAATGGTTGTTGSSSGSAVGATADGPCPVEPVPVVVTVDQWSDAVRQLGGGCVTVTTIITGSSGDPHDYEPTPADTAALGQAELVVMNGVDYDHWAEKAVDALPTKPAVVDGGQVTGRKEGDNPHLWYSPEAVGQMSTAITSELTTLAPSASAYFAARAQGWQAQLAPYEQAVQQAKAAAGGKAYGATESVFDDMATAVGLRNVTPEGFQQAAANESEPAPGDVNDFEQALRSKRMDVLVYNVQTEGAVPEQIRGVAEASGVPVVEVTETLPPGQSSFVAWQVAQLRALVQALGG